MLALARQLPLADVGPGRQSAKSRLIGVEITRKLLGIIGCGNIGAIGRPRPGLKMKVVAFDHFYRGSRPLNAALRGGARCPVSGGSSPCMRRSSTKSAISSTAVPFA